MHFHITWHNTDLFSSPDNASMSFLKKSIPSHIIPLRNLFPTGCCNPSFFHAVVTKFTVGFYLHPQNFLRGLFRRVLQEPPWILLQIYQSWMVCCSLPNPLITLLTELMSTRLKIPKIFYSIDLVEIWKESYLRQPHCSKWSCWRIDLFKVSLKVCWSAL